VAKGPGNNVEKSSIFSPFNAVVMVIFILKLLSF